MWWEWLPCVTGMYYYLQICNSKHLTKSEAKLHPRGHFLLSYAALAALGQRASMDTSAFRSSWRMPSTFRYACES